MVYDKIILGDIMSKSVASRIKLSNKIYPVFYGLSSDLIFFVAINMLFLTEIKGLTSSQVNLITTIGVLVALFFYLTSHKIIKKIGNLLSVRLGTLLILVAALLFTFSKSIILFAIAEILYEVSFVFKAVDTVVLNNNLVYENKEEDFIKIKSKATTIYSIATLIASLVAGFLFNLNAYIPMLICILICSVNFILSHFIYEVKNDEYTLKKEEKSLRLKLNIIVLIVIVTYGLLYGTIAVCQTNDKLLMQYELKKFLDLNNVAVTMSFIIFLSRISRLLSNIFFSRIYDKFKNKVLIVINILLITSVALFLIGNITPSSLYGSIIMGIGFVILLALRDPTENSLSNILLHNIKKENKEQAILYFQFGRRLVVFILSLLATIILNKLEFSYLYIMFLALSLLYLLIVIKLLGVTKQN